ncbi:Bax inhibitor-1 family protein [Ureibacillus thermophilus]|uniref:Bax inhibitor-1 family protein n=1 Tax=Ureibacillus thermophilus TaxID=367743 RepID=UPI00361C7261
MYGHHISLVLKHFALMWALSALGFILAVFLPSSIVLVVSIIDILFLLVVLFVRNLVIAEVFLYMIPFFTGMLFFWLAQFVISIGTAFLYSIFIGTAILFIFLALLGLKMLLYMTDGAAYIAASLLILVFFVFIYFFIPFEGIIYFLISGFLVLAIVLFTVYHFNLIRHHYVRENAVVNTALRLYLSFINILIFSLEFLTGYKRR